MPLGVGACLVRMDSAAFHQVCDQGVIARELAKFPFPEQIKPAIAHVSEAESITYQGECRAGGPHSDQLDRLTRLFLNVTMGFEKSLEQPVLWIGLQRMGVSVRDPLHGKNAGDVATLASPHAIGDDGQAAQTFEIFVARRLPISEAVFVVLAHATNISLPGEFKPWTRLRRGAHSEVYELYVTIRSPRL